MKHNVGGGGFMGDIRTLGMTILLIEDEQKLSSVLQKGLELERYVVDVAYDGEEGLTLGIIVTCFLLCSFFRIHEV